MKRTSMHCAILTAIILISILCLDTIYAVDTDNFDVTEFEDTMIVGSSQTIMVTIYPEGSNKTVKYRSYDKTIAEVSPSGMITAKKKGTTKILISMGKVKKKLDLKVIMETERIELNSRYVTLKHGEQFSIKAKVIPKGAEQALTYKSLNTNIIRVDKNGVITGVKSGVAAIIISNGQLSESTTVVVNQNVQPKSKVKKTEVEQRERSQEHGLAAKIKSSTSKQISFYASPGETIDKEALKELQESGKEVIVKSRSFDFLLAGEEIVNCENEIDTKFGIQKTENGVRIQVNRGNPLPGKIILCLHDQNMKDTRHVYLYDESKDQYQMLDIKNGSYISIDLGGDYYLTFNKLHNFKFRPWHVLVGVLFMMLSIGLYVISKKRYWFW